MNVIIVGCGETGCRLAAQLDGLGHDVSVIDINADKFEGLPEDFGGLCVRGSGTQDEVLRRAGCENADAAAVLTSDDNVNIMSAEILGKVYGIDNVYVRLLDSSRESVFSRFGLHTVCSTRMEADAFLSLILDENGSVQPLNIRGVSMKLVTVKAERKHMGKKPSELFCKDGEMLFGVMRRDGAFLLANEEGLTFREGDKLIYALV